MKKSELDFCLTHSLYLRSANYYLEKASLSWSSAFLITERGEAKLIRIKPVPSLPKTLPSTKAK